MPKAATKRGGKVEKKRTKKGKSSAAKSHPPFPTRARRRENAPKPLSYHRQPLGGLLQC